MACFKLDHMLEPPKASCTYLLSHDIVSRENQGDTTMDNQQERLEWEISWLAAFTEGEGWISLAKNSSLQHGKRYFRFDPNCGISNTAKDLIDECLRILDKYGVKYNVAKRKGSGIAKGESLKRYEIIMRCAERTSKFLNLIYPYLIGLKKTRAELVLKFINLRQSKPRKSSYGHEEQEIYDKMFSYKGMTQSKILNDLTSGTL